MIPAFVLAIGFTIGVSALCSVLEAMILSTTTAEIESLKRRHPRRGLKLEQRKINVEETSSAILSLNTIANTLGATIVGGLAVQIWSDAQNVLLNVSLAMAAAILFFSEIIPKNVGVIYRPKLQPVLVYPLAWVCAIMLPISRLVGIVVRYVLRSGEAPYQSDEEIILLADKSAQDGTLSHNERDMIYNALNLDNLHVSEIMTPRTVVHGIEASKTVESLFAATPNIPFARIPVYEDSIDTVVGVVRRRDLLSAKARDEDAKTVGEMAHEALFMPDNAVASDALQTFLKSNQQLAVAVDEFGSVSGVVTMEDIIEHIIGQEIFEKDDPAIDMRELARRRQFAMKRGPQRP